MGAKLKTLFQLLRDTLSEFNTDKAPRLAAALAYYTAFSIAPLLLVVISIAGLVWSREAVQDQLDNQIRGLVGTETAETVQELVASADHPQTGVLATVIGVVTLFLGAAGVFGQLQDALNTVWGVQPRPNQGIGAMLRARFLSFTMVFGIGFLLLVSLALSAFLSALNGWLISQLPFSEFVLQIINFIVSFGVVTLLFAVIYKVLPDAKISWRDVWVGAAVTALLFTVGKLLIGLYIGNSSTSSSYGAAGSFVVLLLWIYYSAMIFLFGAEFTQVWARTFGKQIEPSAKAILVNDNKQGQPGNRAGVPNAAKKVYVAQPLTPQIAAAQIPAPPPETRLSRVMLGIIASLATFLVGILIASDRNRGAG
jgi:membrane protein